ncbi:hypothetical protein D1872_302620 [compost metagenome]
MIFSSGISPIDNAAGMPTIKTARESTQTERLRLHDSLSIKYLTGTSSSDTAEVNAAMASSTKNSPPNKKPSGIAEKAAGKAMKMSDGPWSGAMPNENVVGKIISPAMKAYNKSPAPTATVAAPRD